MGILIMMPSTAQSSSSNESLREQIELLTKAIELQNKNFEIEREAEKKARQELTEQLKIMADKITDLEARHKNMQFTTISCCGIAIACVSYIAVPLGLSYISTAQLGGGFLSMISSAFTTPENNTPVSINFATKLSK